MIDLCEIKYEKPLLALTGSTANLFLLLLLLSFFSCTLKQKKNFVAKNGHQIIEQYYGSGNLKSRTEYFNQDKTSYLYIAYYDDGKLMDSVQYIDGVPDGKRIYYDQKNDLTHVENYKDGLLDGVNSGTYGNGVTSFEGYRIKNEKAGEWNFHYPDGKPITYEFYDSSGRLLYFRKYDENGTYQNSNGSTIISVGLADKNLVKGDTVPVSVVSVIPPGCSTKLNVIITKGKNHSENIFSGFLTKARTYIQLPLPLSGNQNLEFKVRVTDNNTGNTEKSELTKSIIVAEK